MEKSKFNNPESFFKPKNKKQSKNTPQQSPNKLPPSSDRNPATDRLSNNRSRTESPSKIIDIMKRAERFN